MSHEKHGSSCGCHGAAAGSTVQTLDELDFERGIWAAAFNGDAARVEKYLSNGGNTEALDSAGYTALHYAARNGHLTVVQLLLDAGARVNAQTRSGCSTPLHKAAYSGHAEAARLLMKAGADPRLLDSDGKMARDKAQENSKTEIMELLTRFEEGAVT